MEKLLFYQSQAILFLKVFGLYLFFWGGENKPKLEDKK